MSALKVQQSAVPKMAADCYGSIGIVRCVQDWSLARQRRWLFKVRPVARQASVSFRVKLTLAENDDQSLL